MNTPPPYYAAPPKKSNVGIIVLIVVGILGVCCLLPSIVGGYFIWGFGKKAVSFMACGWKMEDMRDAMLAYAKAHNGKLPDKEHWQDDIAPYLKPMITQKDLGPFEVPPPNSEVCDVQTHSGVTFNEALSGKKLSSIEDRSSIIVLWETPESGRNRFAAYKEPTFDSGPKLMGQLPRGWVLQPLAGEAYYAADQTGRFSSIPEAGMKKSDGAAPSSDTSATHKV